MLSKRSLGVIPGGIDRDAPAAPSEPLGFTVIAVGTFKDELQKPGISRKLRDINPFWEHLPGKTVALVGEPMLLQTAGRTKRRLCWNVRKPGIPLSPLRAIRVPEVYFASVQRLDALAPFLKEPARSLHGLELSLLADVVLELHRAIAYRPEATEPGLDREGRLAYLSSPEGNLLCTSCKQVTISRQTLSDEWCTYFGPARDVCRECLPPQGGLDRA